MPVASPQPAYVRGDALREIAGRGSRHDEASNYSSLFGLAAEAGDHDPADHAQNLALGRHVYAVAIDARNDQRLGERRKVRSILHKRLHFLPRPASSDGRA